MAIVFDSRNKMYRSPTGAVEEGTRIHFKIVLPRQLQCKSATLLIKGDDSSLPLHKPSMFWCGMYDSDHEMWECHDTLHQAGLYFYTFELETIDGHQILGRDRTNSKGVLGTSSIPYQLTVYRKDFRTPSFLPGGILYQIFPDRFHASGQKKRGIPTDRVLQKEWGKLPSYEPNEKGITENNDYFGGDLRGMEEKLDYLESLGVSCIYLNPIFESHENHRYSTADYRSIDPLLGDEKDFDRLIKSLQKRGMHLILDGVFSHTGSDSVYFNRRGRYKNEGAYQSKNSPYFSWYQFTKWPDEYHSWWGFDTLPETNETDHSFNNFINGQDGVIRTWIRKGASGWRLDVADELPDIFLENLRTAVKEENPDALIIGEVWEDASNKQSYGKRRKYFLGKQLDSVMNYPFREAILHFLKGGNAFTTMETIETILENYPRPVIRVLMNPLGTHDTTRVLTELVGEVCDHHDRSWQASHHSLTEQQRHRGIQLMKLASGMQFTLPGVPCIYYGDEVATEGYRDPFNRTCYPWGNENNDLLSWYRALGQMRKHCPALIDGDFRFLIVEEDLILYERTTEDSALLCAFNRSDQMRRVELDPHYRSGKPLLDSHIEGDHLLLLPFSCSFVKI